MSRNHVVEHGVPHAQPMMLAHGFGCDHNMWRYVWPAFADCYRIVLFDHVGAGGSDPGAYDPHRYASLEGYAEDVLAICEERDLRDVVFVGPSPRYIDDEGYVGGFTREDIDGLLASLESNYLGWSSAMAPAIMGNADRPELGEELTNSFCRADPEIAAQFARTTFLSDNRADLGRVRTPSLVLQCSDDVIAPQAVGEYVHAHLADSSYVLLDATGHCPNLSAPEETVEAIEEFLAR
jgi:sigma-B regulation protein RsbQ